MSSDNVGLRNLTDGSLDLEETELLLDAMRSDAALREEVLDELEDHDLMFRELDPARSDAAFLAGFESLLDGHLGDGDASDGDLGDSGGPDGDGGSLDGFDVVDGSSAPLPDPSASITAAGGSGSAATGASGGMLGWAIGGAIAVAVGTTAVLVNQSPPPAPTPQVVEAPVARSTELVATDDATLKGGAATHTKFGMKSVFSVGVRDGPQRNDVLIKFDVSEVSAEFQRATLRLYCVKTLHGANNNVALAKGLKIYFVSDNAWDEATITGFSRVKPGDRIGVGESPRQGEFIDLDVSGALGLWRDRGGPQLSLYIVPDPKTPEYFESIFASRQHENEDWRPRLILEEPAQ